MEDAGRKVTDARAQWLGYRDTAHYLAQAADVLKRRRIAPRWVGSHYRAIFGGELRGAAKR